MAATVASIQSDLAALDAKVKALSPAAPVATQADLDNISAAVAQVSADVDAITPKAS